jgi:acyl-CoA hydrolase
VYPSGTSHHPVPLGAIDRFVSINSALEVDLWGQVNAEAIGGRQLSGVGGSSDFFEAAYNSSGGRRVIALPATTPSGASRIVPRLAATSVATIPRQMADVIVTEHGVADLRGRTLAERAELLVHIAAPDARSTLTDARRTAVGAR